MRKFTNTLKLIRVVNCLLTMVGVVVGARLTASGPAYYAPFMAAAAAFFVCAAGNVVNDLLDIETDRINHPRRVLVRGLLSKRYAAVLSVILNLLALICAYSAGIAVFTAVVVAIALLHLYNRLLKRVVLAGNMIIAFLGGLTFLTGGLAVDISRAFQLPGPLIPATFAFLFHLIREIVKDAQDIKGDSLDSGRTLPQSIGVRNALIIVLILGLILICLTLVPVWQGWYSLSYEVITIYLIDLPLLIVLILLLRGPSTRRFSFGSTALKIGMALGVVALLLA